MFPQQNGLRDPVLLEAGKRWDDGSNNCIQILFDRMRSHWVCVSNKFSDDEAVEIYDTAPPKTQKIPTCLQRQIATIMKTNKDFIRIRFENILLNCTILSIYPYFHIFNPCDITINAGL